MNELVGLRNINSLNDVNDIKRDLLIFDKLFIVGLKEWKEVFEQKLFKNHMELLKNKGLISLNDFVIYDGLLLMNKIVSDKFGSWENYYAKTKNENIEFRNHNLEYLVDEGKVIFEYDTLTNGSKTKDFHENITPIIESKIEKNKNSDTNDFLQLSNLCHDLKTRILASSYDNSNFTVIPCDLSIYEIKDITNIKAETYNLILEDFPIVNIDNVSWEQIFNFKNDQEIYNSIWGLRNWITNISKSNKSINEIEEEYRYLKNKYEQAIKIHRLKTGNSIFQTTIQTSAELLENIAKLKLRKMTELLFKFKENKISLMESELKSEGNQFSYLFKIKDKFK